ncbi:hypothetical protein NLU13_0532 [Sarocladium strictum]|uniref:Uncharacterized protein n=1 Tax=Sarocladium strictum TaxID=5046 RepID=A0AA39GP83_SARSR|nr:hypothetical protein NLU13_0532 [Sarocladium strictum]
MENSTPTKGSRAKDVQYELAIRVLAHYRQRAANKGVQWNMINMPGRSLKSMQGLFTKINEDIKSLDIDGSAATSGGGGGHETPPTAGKKRARGPAKNAKTKKTPGHVLQTKEEDSDAGDLGIATYPEPALKKRAVTRDTTSQEPNFFEDIKEEADDFEQGLIKSDVEQHDPAAQV